MFQPVDPKQDFIALEHRILDFWRERRIFEKRMEKNAGKKPWSFLDGPITANNPMGVHHAWGRTYKDVFQRYMAMRGFDQRYQNGFDCQGLWLEVETEKDLGFNSKRDIEAYGLDNFSRQCRARVDRFSDVQAQQSIRLGQWMRWDDSYYTMSDTNIEYIWHFLKICREKGWLYEGHRAMPWCTRCGTSLSQHELAEGYEEVSDTSVYLRFPLLDRPDASLLVWTTTPWTLTSNVAAAVNPDLEYVDVLLDGHHYYLSRGAMKSALKGKGEVAGTLRGSEMLGWRYKGPFDELPVAEGLEHRVIPWDEVGEEEGTGIVHIAPGCGAEDNELGKLHGLRVIAPLDGNGIYIGGFGWLTGMDVHDVEKPILQNLKEKGVFFRQEAYRHRYPHCWRCKEKLVFRVEDEWFIACDEIRPLMKAQSETVRYVPESVGKRVLDWYNNMGDWCISRKRYWGLPLPFYWCPDRHLTLIGSRSELRERAIDPSVVDRLPELHRPWIDEVKIRCAECGQTAERVPDVGDCWLDAGIVPFSTLRYLEDRGYWEKWFPAELVCEMREQIRLWFYSMMFLSVTLTGRTPYKAVFAYEKVYDEQGKPMHKSHGNAIWFDEAVEKMGADVMRWLYCAYNPSFNLRFGYHVADEVRRKLLVLWNVYGFFVTYASLDRFDPATARIEETLGQSRNPLDRWILSALHGQIADFHARMDAYDVDGAVRGAEEFIDALSTWYVRRSRRRFWRSGDDEDKLFAYRTLHHVLTTLARQLAPVIPFLTEEIWGNLMGPKMKANGSEGLESVHLTDFPEARADLIDEALNRRMEALLEAVRLGRAAREKVQIKIRQPLSRMWLVALSGQLPAFGEDLMREMAEELNVKEVRTDRHASEVGEATIKLNFPVLGKRLGGSMKAVQNDVRDGRWELAPDGRLLVGEHPLEPEEFELAYQPRAGLALATDGRMLVAIDTELTEDLLMEGYARELIRAVQDLRKRAGYQVEDRIELRWEAVDPAVTRTMEKFTSGIAGETLAAAVHEGHGLVDMEATVELGPDLSCWIGVRR
ncbi:MAG: isoleucine--tRNA ligase [Candidatus Eisenbacteria bacterium]|nr:isoleucine--tRNA ligase [Candidatus Eisenbacteria bacterium]